MKTEKIKKLLDRLIPKFEKVIKSVWAMPGEESLIILLDDTEDIDSITYNQVKNETEIALKGLGKDGAKMHAVFYKLSDYWELIRHGSPVTFTEINEGIALYDPSGFFVPIKKLITEGRVPGTKEAMKNLLQQAPYRLLRIERMHMIRVVEELFSSVVDAAQAPLIIAGVAPPIPRELPEKLETHFVKAKKLEPEYVRYCEQTIKTWKDLEHGKIKDVDAERLDELIENSSRFVERMEKLIENLGK